MTQRVTVIGSGYVGTVVAACLAHVGHSVVGVEADEGKLDALCAGLVPFHEPGLQQLLESGLAAGTLRFTDDMSEAMDASEVVFVCVGTPPGPDGQPDMTAMSGVAHELARQLREYHVIVTKSTVPIGTGFWLGSLLEEELGPGSVGSLFDVVSNPEFLREGNAVQDYLHPDRVVLGSTSREALGVLVEVYRPILEQQLPGDRGRRDPVPVLLTGLATAEMTKYASNAFLATKISFANEIARLCDFVGADVTEVTAGMGLDTRIGSRFLDSGLGWGGSCFGKDLQALVGTAKEYGYRSALLEAAISVNESQRQLAVDQLLRLLKTLRGARVALLGLAFKPDTDDLRDSPALDIARRLVQRGSFVSAYDPMVRSLPAGERVRVVGDAYSAALGADAIVVATEWPQLLDLDLARLHAAARGNVFVDGRNLFDPAKLRAAGFVYVGIGRPAEAVGPASAARLRSSSSLVTS